MPSLRRHAILPDALPGGRQNRDVIDGVSACAFYPTHFRGEGKTTGASDVLRQYFTRRTSGGKAKPLVAVCQHRCYFTRRTSGGKAKLLVACQCTLQILPDALPGGRQNAQSYDQLRVNFTRRTSGGRQNPCIRDCHTKFYPTHFRGKAKPRRRCTALAILPDALPGGRQNRYNAACHNASILPDALPGGRQNSRVHSARMYFTRRTSGGRQNYHGMLLDALKILPDALPGGRQNVSSLRQLHADNFTRRTSGGKAKLHVAITLPRSLFYPTHFRGEGKTQYANCRYIAINFTRRTSGGKAKL